MSSFTPKPDKLEFRNIVLGQVKNVLDLSLQPTQDFRLKSITINSAVLFLSDVLAPFYDDEMNNEYGMYLEGLEYLKKHTEVVEGNYRVERFNYDGLYEITRELFRALNLLLKRVDFLKSSIYGDGDNESDDEIVEDEEVDG